MSYILDDFKDDLIDLDFIADHCHKNPVELMAFINKPNGYAEGFNGFGFTYSLKEINVLLAHILDTDSMVDNGGNILDHDFNANYDSVPQDTGLSPAQRNGRL